MSALDETVIAEEFRKASKVLFYDPDGSGGRAGVRIATLTNGVNLRNSDITIVAS